MNTKPHFDYLDALRGIAALIVVFTHIGVRNFNQELFSNIPAHFLVAGSAAVVLFFVHSGYVLCYKYIGTPDCKLKIIEAIIKRPFRLLGVLLFATYLTLIHNRNIIGRPEGESFIFGPLLHPFTFGIPWNGSLWTLDVELVGSFITFGLLLFISNARKELRLAIMLILMVCFRNNFYCAFMFGIITADIDRNWRWQWFIEHRNAMSWILLIPAILLFSYPQNIPPNVWYKANEVNTGYVLVTTGAMLMFAVVLMNSRIQQFLLYNRFVTLGKISYSMYAIHMPVIAFMSGTVINRYLCWYFETTMLFRCIVILPVIITLSWLVNKYIDRPCIELSGRIARYCVSTASAVIKNINCRIREANYVKAASRESLDR